MFFDLENSKNDVKNSNLWSFEIYKCWPVNSLGKEKYCNKDHVGDYCCAKKDVFTADPGFLCNAKVNVNVDEFGDFDEQPHMECKCKGNFKKSAH